MRLVGTAALLLTAALSVCGIPLTISFSTGSPSCHVTSLHFVRSASCASAPARSSCWSISLSHGNPTSAWRNLTLSPKIFANFIAHSGCRGLACSALTVPCVPSVKTRSPADPSDALWFNAYNSGDELLVLARIGSLALLLFVAAIVCEGAIFRPRRMGVAQTPLVALTLLALSALLQLLLIPRRWQPALAGGGFGESIAYVALVVFGAIILPGVVLLLQTLAVMYVNLLLLVVQIVFWTVLGLVQFSYTLLYFHFANLWLQIRALYQIVPPVDEENEGRDMYMSQLYYSGEFLRMLGQNAVMVHVSATVNQMSRMVLRSTMAPHLYDRLVGQHTESSANDGTDENTPLL